jgi:hypothetical protein
MAGAQPLPSFVGEKQKDLSLLCRAYSSHFSKKGELEIGWATKGDEGRRSATSFLLFLTFFIK